MVHIPFHTSYWFHTPEAVAAPLTRDNVVDVAIIGGGYAGLSSALAIKQASPALRVALVEANHLGFGASGRNAGWLSSFTPLMWVGYQLSQTALRDDFAFAARFGNEAIAALGKSFGAEHHPESWRATQHYLLARNLFEKALINWLAGRVNQCGFACSVTNRIQDHPVANYPHVASMQWNTVMVDPYHIIRHLRAQCISNGVMLFEQTPIASITSAARHFMVTSRQGATLTAEKVVLCTNAYTGQLTLDQQVPKAHAHHTYMLATAPLTPEQIAAVATTRISFGDPSLWYYCARFHGNRLLFNGIDRPSKATLQDDHQPAIFAKLHREMVRRFPALRDVAIESAWGGPFMETSTETPIVRASKNNPNLIYNIGYGGGSGIGAALQSGRLVTDLVLGDASHDADAKRLRAIYDARRFPLLGPGRAALGVAGQLLRQAFVA